MGLHTYILCKDEEKDAMPLTEFLNAKGIQVTERFTPPGSHEEKLFTSDDGKRTLRGVSKTFNGLHKCCKKTVKSKLKIENIWVTAEGDIKLKNVELCSASRSKVNTTYKRLAQLLRKHLFRKDLPVEIEQWFRIMESKSSVDAFYMMYLIRCHPSIMADRNKLELLMRIYKHLWPIKAKLRDTYDRITQGLPYEVDWTSLVTDNDFLSEVYYYEDKYGNRIVYEAGIPGLMQFLKNCDSHLHEKALPKNTSEPLFQSWHLAPMTFGSIPLFIGALAERMYEHNELQGLEVQDLMA